MQLTPLEPTYLRDLNDRFNCNKKLPDSLLIRLHELKKRIFRHIGLRILEAGANKEKLLALSTNSNANFGQRFKDNRLQKIYERVFSFIHNEVRFDRSMYSLLHNVVPTILTMDRLFEIPAEDLDDIPAAHQLLIENHPFPFLCVIKESESFVCEFVKNLTEEEVNDLA